MPCTDAKCGSNGPIKESDVFSTIDRINKKLASLESMLSPIINSTPTTESEKGFGTQLSNELHSVEDRVSYLLDCIRL